MPRVGAQSEQRAAALASLAGSQHGIVEYRQMIRLGFTRREIQGMVRRQRLHRIHRGVYAVGHPRLTREGRYMAAVLACGPDAVLSHWSAAAVWGLLRPLEQVIAISAPAHHRGPDGVKFHWTRKLDSRDRTIRDGIPVTTVPRTVLDLAALSNEPMVTRAANQADRGGWLSPGILAELQERHAAARGWPRSGRPPQTSRRRPAAPRATSRSAF
jgi:putative AbiEi antitoxin of type IV toxin-antitoxin system